MYQPLTGLTNARVDLMTSLVSFERVFEVLDAPDPIQERPGAVDLVAPTGRVTFDDVRFRYPPAAETSIASLEQHAPTADPDRDVLDGLTLDVAPGETVALVGVSGAGKSTMVSLVPRLYDVTAGAVRIDGHDVRDLTLDSLRAAIGVVAQDPHLFHESIGDNLRYAKPDATTDELVAACRAARILDTVTALPDGFDTVVGDRGYRLSGGEKQRLAIARLLLKDPAVMILDEATSHLDNDNEAQVQAALDAALFGRTAIVIAHRLSTIRHADRIAVLDDGRIVELGTHDELVALDGRYAAQLRAGDLVETVDHVTRLPLADVRVLDLSTVIAGPNCARYLADFGADVIKVERPGGDSLRNMAWRDDRDGEGLWFKLANRNKRMIVVDLKDDDDRELVLAPGRRRPRARRELPARTARAARARPRRAARAQPAPRHHAGLRLRAGRSVRRAAGVRHDRRGDVRVGGDQRRARRAAAAAADRPHRRGHRARRRLRHDGRPAQRAGPGRRRQPAGDDVPPDGSAAVAVRAARRAAAAARRRAALHGAAGHLPLRGRPVDRRVDEQRLRRHAGDGAARARRRRALHDVRRPRRAPRRARGGDDVVVRGAHVGGGAGRAHRRRGGGRAGDGHGRHRRRPALRRPPGRSPRSTARRCRR